MPGTVPIEALHRAKSLSAGALHETPLIRSETLSKMVGAEVFLKCENLQKTGSFKVRGALNRLRSLGDQAAEPGVVTVSAGNHAQALAWASGITGSPATVVMPAAATASKVQACEAYGARVVLLGTVFEAFEEALRLANEEGFVFVHPFDEPEIIAGQGTVGLEVVDVLEDVETIVVPVGGGGLISGIAVAASAHRSPVKVVGVEPSGADSMARSLSAGRAVRLERVDTVADGLGSPMAGELTFQHVRSLVDDVVVLDDEEILRAMRLIASRTKLVVEPAGAAGVAALLSGQIRVRPGSRVVAVLSGGNADLGLLGSPTGLAGPP